MTKKRLFGFIFFAMLFCALISLCTATASAEATIKIGEYVVMGTYYDEPILWRCVDIDETGPLMMSDRIL